MKRIFLYSLVTDIPNIPLPDRYAPTHTFGERKVQAIATVGGFTVCRYAAGGSGFMAANDRLTPLPPSLPKAREGWYVLTSKGTLHIAQDLEVARMWRNDCPQYYVAVVELCGDGRFYHVTDRDGTLGDPVEVGTPGEHAVTLEVETDECMHSTLQLRSDVRYSPAP